MTYTSRPMKNPLRHREKRSDVAICLSAIFCHHRAHLFVIAERSDACSRREGAICLLTWTVPLISLVCRPCEGPERRSPLF